MMVSSTGSGQIYNYHKATLKEADLLSLSNDINDFAARYRVASSAPSSSLDEGDLWWDSNTDKLKVYSGASSSWEEVASAGDFYINTIASYSGTGGNSSTFNGSAYRFVLSNPGTTAQQHVVSVNGVIQKPNSGTSQPSEGFVIDGSSIIFSNAPATGSDYFILTLGTTVSIGTPSDNTVSTAKIQNLAVTGDKIATNLDLADNKKIRFGTGNDLQIYHDSNNSAINHNGTGDLYIQSNNNLYLRNYGGDNYIRAVEDGAVELYYDNVKKIATYSSGVEVTGTLFIPDGSSSDNRVSLGSGGDFKFYHDGTDSFITNGTGNLNLVCDSAQAINLRHGAENMLRAITDGAVELYHDNVKKLETTSTGVQISGTNLNMNSTYIDFGGNVSTPNTGAAIFRPAADSLAVSTNNVERVRVDSSGNLNIPNDSGKIRCGTGADLQIYHDGSHSWLTNSTGNLVLRNNAAAGDIHIQPEDAEEGVIVRDNGAVELYYDNSLKFDTQSDGVKFYGHLYTNDANKIQLGNSQDLQIYHDGSNSFIYDSGTGNLYVRSSHLRLEDDVNDPMITAIKDGAVELYYDASKKLETILNGVQTNGSHFVMDGDGANGNPKFACGDSADLSIYHDGSNSYIRDSGTGYLITLSDQLHLNNADNSDNMIKCVGDGTVELYYDGSKKLETYSAGSKVTGWMQAYGNEGDSDHGTSATKHVLQSNLANQAALILEHSNDNNPYGVYIDFSDSTPDNTTHWFISCDDSAANRMKVFSNGNLGNANTSYSGLSDIKLKENIVDAKSQWDDIKSIKVRNYNFKESTGYQTHKQIGVIAQEIESISPGLVFESPDTDKDQNDLGTTTKSVNYSVLQIKAFKALQEAMAKIETLETKVAALEAK